LFLKVWFLFANSSSANTYCKGFSLDKDWLYFWV